MIWTHPLMEPHIPLHEKRAQLQACLLVANQLQVEPFQSLIKFFQKTNSANPCITSSHIAGGIPPTTGLPNPVDPLIPKLSLDLENKNTISSLFLKESAKECTKSD